jgi:spore coat assemly protein
MQLKIGDFVTRRSHNSDVIFKIERINGNEAILRSYRIRLMANAFLDDLIRIENISKKKIKKNLIIESYNYLQRQQRNFILNSKQVRKNPEYSYREYPGRILHIDGDEDYLELSMNNYKNLQINAKGFFISERGQPEKILEYLRLYKPDILVITGHDGILNGKEYYTSEYFIKAVRIARSYEPDLDSLVIFAGACQSDYEKLIDNGANFASSPQKALIHFLDPILVVEKIAYTSIRDVIKVKEIVKNTITGDGGVGGIETRGKLRMKYP